MAPVQNENRTVYLSVDSSSFYEITPNASVTIGRLDTNDVVLDDYKVSREHAILKYVQGEFILLDMASTHGTYFHGQRIERAVLEIGLPFNIVGHELVLMWQVPTSSAGQIHRSRSLDRRLKFFGGLNEFSLLTLVQFLYQEKQSGLLILEVGQKPGPRIYFEAGEVTHVIESNAETLSDLLTRQYHETSLFFYFHHETQFPARTVFKSTPSFLLDMCHALDVKNSEDAVSQAKNENHRDTTSLMEIEPPAHYPRQQPPDV